LTDAAMSSIYAIDMTLATVQNRNGDKPVTD
jgi:hypothetical protein